jgi:hypothetical protein
MVRLLDVLLQLDHLKNAKASIPNDFSWYKRYKFGKQFLPLVCNPMSDSMKVIALHCIILLQLLCYMCTTMSGCYWYFSFSAISHVLVVVLTYLPEVFKNHNSSLHTRSPSYTVANLQNVYSNQRTMA